MQKFGDLDRLRQDMKSVMPLSTFIELVDGKQLERVHEDLYKKRCDLDDHPTDQDGTKDSTPSFTVCPSKELWYCFGCGIGGDRFEYVSRKLHMDHIEAVIKAAEIMGFNLNPYYVEQSQEEAVKDSLFSENNQARNIAHDILLYDKRAMDYLLGRGISMDSIGEFKLGYAPPMDGGKITVFDAVPNSILLQLDRRDQFNDAILFPVCDSYGRMRYFQSRPFTPMTGMKYIGGSDSHPLYEETDRLYGFHIARKSIHKFGGRLVGVEGAPDTIVCNQHGIPTIGFLGTTVNQNTFDMLDRYRVRELIMLLDGDKAGRDRTVKICEKYLAMNTGVRLRVAQIPDGDPDEFINANGASALVEIVDQSQYAVHFLIDNMWDNMETTTPTGKIGFIGAVRQYVYAIHDKLVMKVVTDYIASKVGIDPVEVEDYYTSVSAKLSDISLYTPDGEEILLGEALRNPDFIVDLSTKMRSDDWYLTKHKRLFDILRESQFHDVDSVYTTAKNLGYGDLITHQWLQTLYDKGGNVEFSMGDVQDKLIRRKVKDKLQRLDTSLMDMSNNPSVVVDQSISDIYNITVRQADNVVDGRSQVTDVMSLIHERMKDPGKIIGYDLGPNFKRLTRAMLGVQTKTFTVVAANQSVGKTQLGENWAMYMSVAQQIPSLWFTLEMDTTRMTFRNLSILSGVPLTALQTGNITVEQKIQEVDPWAARLAQSPFYMTEYGHDLNEALSTARRYVIRKGVKVIFIDYLQLMYIGNLYGKKRYEELGMMSKAWKQFAKETDTAIIALSQLSKQALEADIAKAEHGAGSYEVAQDADNYLTMKEKSEEEIKQNGIENGNIVANLDKNRMGVADILVNLYSDRNVQRMMEVPGGTN